MAQITYTNKQFVNQNANVPAINKVQDSDMNEIKSVVNGLLTDSTSNDSTLGYTAPFLNGITIEDSGTGYIRFGDGTQICYGSIASSTFSVPNNNVCTASKNFAKSFNAVPNVIVSLSGPISNQSNELTINVKVSTITASNFSISEQSSSGAFGTAARRLPVQFIAIGTWK